MERSIIMCTYNGRNYVEEQLQSFLSQTLVPSEIVIVDDGSTDGCYEWLLAFVKEYAGPIEFQLIQNEQRLGSIKSFEKALQKSKSEWVAFSDQDDAWEANKLQTLWQEKGDAQLVFSDAQLMDESGQLLGKTLWQELNFSPALQSQIGVDPLSVLKSHFVVTGAAMMVHRNWALQSIPFPLELHHDAWLAWEIALSGGKIRALPETLWKYRIHSKQQVGVGLKKSLFSYVNRFFKREDQYLQKLIRAYRGLLLSHKLESNSEMAREISDRCFFWEHRLDRRNIAFKILWSDYQNGYYQKYSTGLQSFVKDGFICLLAKIL